MGYVCLHDIFDWRSERCFALQHDIPRIVSLRYDTNQFSIVHDKQRADVFVSHFCKWHRVPLCSGQWSTGTGPFVQEDVLWSWRASLLLALRSFFSYPLAFLELCYGQNDLDLSSIIQAATTNPKKQGYSNSIDTSIGIVPNALPPVQSKGI